MFITRSAIIVLCLLLCLASAAQAGKPTHSPSSHSTLQPVIVGDIVRSETRQAVFSPSSRIMASTDLWGRVRLWDIASGQLLRSFDASKGDNNEVEALDFSPDSKTLASGGHDGYLILWNVASGTQIKSLTGDSDGISAVRFSPDGKLIASSGHNSDHTVKLWNTATGKLLRVLKGHHRAVGWINFSRDGISLTTKDFDGTVKSWVVSTGKLLTTPQSFAHKTDADELSPNGKIRAVYGNGDAIKLRDAKSGRLLKTLTGHSEQISSLSVSPDGRMLAFGNGKKAIKLWDLVAGHVLTTLTSQSETVDYVGFNLDGTMLASDDAKKIALWSMPSGTLIRKVPGSGGFTLQSASFSPDGKTIACVGENKIQVWRISDDQAIMTFPVKDLWINGVVYSPDGKILAASFEDGAIKLWAMPSGRLIRILHSAGAFGSMCFSPDGKVLAIEDEIKDTIKLWQVATGNWLHSIPQIPIPPGSSGKTIPTQYSPDGQWLTGGSFTTAAYAYRVGGRPVNLISHTETVTCATFLPNRPIIVTGSEDGTVKLWHLPDGKLLATLYTLDDHDWAVVDSTGRFDGTPAALSILHYVIGLIPFDLSTIKDRYQDPGLLAKILGYDKTPLRKVTPVTDAILHPLVPGT